MSFDLPVLVFRGRDLPPTIGVVRLEGGGLGSNQFVQCIRSLGLLDSLREEGNK